MFCETKMFINRRVVLVGIAVALPTAVFAQNASYPVNVSPPEAQKLVGEKKAILIDIRTPEEWRETGVAETAHKLDMNDPMFLAKLSALTGGDRAKPVALICRTANRTRTVQQALLQSGYATIINVEGGMVGNSADKGWLKHGLPVVKEE
jgi:rhodanese-related sulfurtransferase